MMNLSAVEFNHLFLVSFAELLKLGYVDSPKTAKKHPLAHQQEETILDVLKREFLEVLDDPENERHVKTLNETLEKLVDNRGDVKRMEEDGSFGDEKPLWRKQTISLAEKAAKVKADPNSLFIGDIFSN